MQIQVPRTLRIGPITYRILLVEGFSAYNLGGGRDCRIPYSGIPVILINVEHVPFWQQLTFLHEIEHAIRHSYDGLHEQEEEPCERHCQGMMDLFMGLDIELDWSQVPITRTEHPPTGDWSSLVMVNDPVGEYTPGEVV